MEFRMYAVYRKMGWRRMCHYQWIRLVVGTSRGKLWQLERERWLHRDATKYKRSKVATVPCNHLATSLGRQSEWFKVPSRTRNFYREGSWSVCSYRMTKDHFCDHNYPSYLVLAHSNTESKATASTICIWNVINWVTESWNQYITYT